MLLKGQRFVVTGIASKLSIAWAIAESLHREGAQLILTYPNDKIKKRVDMAAEAFDAVAVIECDVGSDESIQVCFDEIAKHWGVGDDKGIDGIVHAIGFAPPISLMAILPKQPLVKAVKLPMISQATVLSHLPKQGVNYLLHAKAHC